MCTNSKAIKTCNGVIKEIKNTNKVTNSDLDMHFITHIGIVLSKIETFLFSYFEELQFQKCIKYKKALMFTSVPRG
jgi:hypothetical protein